MWRMLLISKDENFLPVIFHDLNSVAFHISSLKKKKNKEEEEARAYIQHEALFIKFS